MVYLGQPAGYKGFCFYWLTNGCIFIGITAIFDETLFSCCPDGKQWTFTEIDDQPPPKNRYPEDPSDPSDDNFGNHPLFPLENDGDAPPSSPPSKNNDPQGPEDHPSHIQKSTQLPQWQGPEQPAAPQCSKRQQTAKSQPDSIYGDHPPTDLQHDDLRKRAGNQLDSTCTLLQPGSGSIPGSSQAPLPLSQTTDGAGDDTGEDPVITTGYVIKLIWKGGVEFFAFLLNKVFPVMEWTLTIHLLLSLWNEFYLFQRTIFYLIFYLILLTLL